jgi:hypothetical protein
MPNKSSKYSDEGTAAHFLASVALSNNTQLSDYLGLRICLWNHIESDSSGEEFEENLNHDEVVVTASFTVDDDMVEEVGKYVDYVRGIRDAVGADLYVEQRLSLVTITEEEGAEGTSDTVLIDYNNAELIIIDLKYGQGESVEVENNFQLIIYALAALEKFKHLIDFKTVRTVIHQPRKNYVGEHSYSVMQMMNWKTMIKNGAAETRKKNAPIVPGKKQCRWCKLSGNCKEQDAYVQKEMEVSFDDISGGNKPTVHDDTPELINKKMAVIDFVEDWCKAVRAQAESMLLSGVALADWKIVKGKMGNRQWTDEVAVTAVMKSFRLKVEEMYKLSLISPTVAEKMLKDNPKRWAKLQDLIRQSEGGPSVAHVSDKRPALTISVVEFEDQSFNHLI